MNDLTKPYRFALMYGLFLTCISAYTLLDAFVIPKAEAQVVVQSSAQSAGKQAEEAPEAGQPSAEQAAVITDSTYRDANIQITIETGRAFDSDYYVADIVLSSADYLKTALAEETYGRNIKQTTSAMAAAHNAILAINGDYYGFRDTGSVLRNGVLYRGAGSGNSGEALLIDEAGDFAVVAETRLANRDLEAEGIWQAFSFGPGLVVNGESTVVGGEARSQGASQNPRTAIGQISPLHYIVMVVDGRTTESRGVTLAQLAELFVQYGCETAYNLDGGGSSTMVFNGTIINQPTDGRKDGERQVSDIVYIGLE